MSGLAAILDEETPFQHHVLADGENALLEHWAVSLSISTPQTFANKGESMAARSFRESLASRDAISCA